MADPYKDAPWQQGDILRADELNAMQTGLSPLGTVIPWALPWNPTDAPDDYSNVTQFAPFHLPCTGVVYPTSRAPELSAAIGHRFVDGEPDVGDVGDYVSGAALNKHHGSGYENTGIYRRTATGFDLVEANGFCTPDLRGRAPFGDAGTLLTTGDEVAAPFTLGRRYGDARVPLHQHTFPGSWSVAPGGSGANNDLNGNVKGVSWYGNYTKDGFGSNHWIDQNNPHNVGQTYSPAGNGRNVPPGTGVNFLIACGVSGSATPSTRSGEIHRLHAVTSDHMIRQRLADPDLPDEEREALEAILAGEPLPPPPDEPPATRTTTTTRKTATRKRKKS